MPRRALPCCAAAFVTVALIAGCTATGDASTTCRTFTGLTKDDQAAVVAKVLKERNARNSSTSDVVDRVRSTTAFCTQDANRDKTIGEMP
jgi:acid stress chaperone HdeA